jgi:hypothetical protein
MQTNSKYSSILLYEAQNRPVNEVVYLDEQGNRITIHDSVVKILKDANGEELVVLKSGLQIPIELIYQVDFEVSPYHSDDFFQCDCV